MARLIRRPPHGPPPVTTKGALRQRLRREGGTTARPARVSNGGTGGDVATAAGGSAGAAGGDASAVGGSAGAAGGTATGSSGGKTKARLSLSTLTLSSLPSTAIVK